MGAWGVPTWVVAVAALRTRVVSLAVSVHVPVVANSTVENVATPAIAVADTGAARQVELIVIASLDPAFVVSTFPLASSTETLKAVTTVPVAATVAGGATLNASFAGGPPVTVTSVLD
jgi:hypothetical protein